jgi:transmembrane sensor
MRHVLRAAAQWLALMESGGASAEDEARLQHWRDSDQRHEHAWQKAQQVRTRFSGLPPSLALASLDRPALDRRQLLKRALGIAVVAPAAWLVYRQLPLAAWSADVQTATGERRQLALGEGASLQLNTATAVDIDGAACQVRLVDGELALSVQGGAAMTLLTAVGQVQVSDGEVCARQYREQCRVVVLRGVAQVQPLGGPALLLRAGQQVRLSEQGAGAVQPWDLLQPDWRTGVLSAQNLSLADFLTELGRYRPGILQWSPQVAALRVTGSFRLDDTDRILSLLSASLPVQVQSRTRYWITVQGRDNAA